MITIKNTRFRLSTMSVESFSRKELSVSCFSFAGLLIRSANHPFRLEFRSRAVVSSQDLTPSVPHKTGYYIIPDFGFPRKYKTVQSPKALKKLYSVYKKHLSFSTYQRAYFRNFAHFGKVRKKQAAKGPALSYIFDMTTSSTPPPTEICASPLHSLLTPMGNPFVRVASRAAT